VPRTVSTIVVREARNETRDHPRYRKATMWKTIRWETTVFYFWEIIKHLNLFFASRIYNLQNLQSITLSQRYSKLLEDFPQNLRLNLKLK